MRGLPGHFSRFFARGLVNSISQGHVRFFLSHAIKITLKLSCSDEIIKILPLIRDVVKVVIT